MSSHADKPRGRFAGLIAREWGTIAFTILAVLFFVGSFGLRGEAGYFPMGVSIATSIFGVAALALAFNKGDRPEDAASEADSLAWNGRTVLTLVWFAGALAVTYVLGIVVGAAIASTIYFFILTPVRPVYALLNGVVFSAFIWVVFEKLASLPIYDGIF